MPYIKEDQRFNEYKEIVLAYWKRKISGEVLLPENRIRMEVEAGKQIEQGERKEFFERLCNEEKEMVEGMEEYSKVNNLNQPFLGDYFYGN